jgi:hypothetical protein
VLPFTTEQFLEVFQDYNDVVWPAQIVLILLAVMAIGVAVRPIAASDRLISIFLSTLWAWSAVVYHWRFFTEINRAAWGFGLLFLVQAVLFLNAGLRRRTLAFGAAGNAAGVLGGILITYSLLVYPVIGHMLGHHYPRSPTFGVPCPTLIFTFGMLLWASKPVPRHLLVIPAVWSVVGSSAAILLEMREDYGLLPAAIVTITGMLAGKRP